MLLEPTFLASNDLKNRVAIEIKVVETTLLQKLNWFYSQKHSPCSVLHKLKTTLLSRSHSSDQFLPSFPKDEVRSPGMQQK